MAVVIKSLFLALACAIFGIAVHRAATDTNAIGSVAIASTLPDLSQNQASSSTQFAENTSGESRLDHFQHLAEHLKAARTAVEAMPGYTAILEMQEEVDDNLRPIDRVEFKTRRQPFSVYMRWSDNEQEALYVHGENDNRLIVKPTKGLAAIRRIWRLDPDSRMAKQTCRYPITDVGIENLVVRIQEFYGKQNNIAALAECRMEHSRFSNQDVVIFDIKFKDEAKIPAYSASRFCFDGETQLLIAVDNYGWSNDDKPRLIEHYFYDEIAVLPSPTDEEFTEENPEYHFVAR